MQALWKQEQELHPAFKGVNQCLREDWFLLPHELKLQRAHARALAAADILSPDELAAIERALDAIGRGHLGGACPESDAEDLHTWIETMLTAQAGEAGRKVHTARSRNDQVATLLKLYVIDAGTRLSEELSALIEAFCWRAKSWSELVFPLQTHSQFAAPGTVGFWALRYAVALDRVRRQIGQRVVEWRRFCPLGSGAVAGSSIPIDRQIQATELGFDGPSLNALDSTCARDECIESLAIAAQLALHLQSFSTDVILFGQSPLSWTVYPRAFGTGSSMMPNKANPDAMELLRGESAVVAGAHGQALLLLKGLPSGYNRDLQCIKPIVQQTAEKLVALCRMTAAFVGQLEFDEPRLTGSLAQGEIGATLRMEEKVVAGKPLRAAHHEVAAELARADSDAGACEAADAARYRTVGGASPVETRRIAELLLAALGERPPRAGQGPVAGVGQVEM